MNTPHLFGPAGRLANLFARTLEESAEPVKLLLTGPSGIGKTSLALQTARNLCAGEWGVSNMIGRKVTIHVVNQWEEEFASSSLYGSGWKVVVVEEIDTCQKDALDALLFVLDTMGPNRAIIGTTNLPFAELPERFVSRFSRHEVAAPEPEEIAAHLTAEFGAPEMIAQQIAFLCGGNVRAAELDAKAWANEHAPKAKRARVIQPGFDLISAEGA